MSVAVVTLSSYSVFAGNTCTDIAPICEGADQCQGTCCFATATCSSSSANNCALPASALFIGAGVAIPGDKLETHSQSELDADGCICEPFVNELGLACDPEDPYPATAGARCWGTIQCDAEAGGTCATGGGCAVSI